MYKIMIQRCFIGIDISKEKVDVACIDKDYKVLMEKVIPNDQSKLNAFFKGLFRKFKLSESEVLICCEQTGIYNRPLEQVCINLGIPLWVEMAIKIKRAASSIRGKSDRQDALRIADYARR